MDRGQVAFFSQAISYHSCIRKGFPESSVAHQSFYYSIKEEEIEFTEHLCL